MNAGRVGQRAGAGVVAALPPVPAGTITTVAGGPGGPGKATSVSLEPCGLAATAGGFYTGDNGPNLLGQSVRLVTEANDQLTTVAGTNAGGPLGLGDPATSAELCYPQGSAGLLIADTGYGNSSTSRIRLISG